MFSFFCCPLFFRSSNPEPEPVTVPAQRVTVAYEKSTVEEPLEELCRLCFPENRISRRVLFAEIVNIWNRRPETLATLSARHVVWRKAFHDVEIALRAIIIFRQPYDMLFIAQCCLDNEHLLAAVLETNVSRYGGIELNHCWSRLIGYLPGARDHFFDVQMGDEEDRIVRRFVGIVMRERVAMVTIKFRTFQGEVGEKWLRVFQQLPIRNSAPPGGWRSAIESKSSVVYKKELNLGRTFLRGALFSIVNEYNSLFESKYYWVDV